MAIMGGGAQARSGRRGETTNKTWTAASATMLTGGLTNAIGAFVDHASALAIGSSGRLG
jgi:hypothetical protein